MLRGAPDTADQFDEIFGVGSAARALSEAPPPAAPKADRIFPLIDMEHKDQITSGHVLRSLEDGNVDAAAADILSATEAKRAEPLVQRDAAIIQSFLRAIATKAPLDWDFTKSADEANTNVSKWQERRKQNSDPDLAGFYETGESMALKREQVTLDMQAKQKGWLPKLQKDTQTAVETSAKALASAYDTGHNTRAVELEYSVNVARQSAIQDIAEDRRRGIKRVLSEQQRIQLAEVYQRDKSAVDYARDALDAARRTPNADLALPEEQLKNALARFYSTEDTWGIANQRAAVDNPWKVGETLRSAVRTFNQAGIGAPR